MAQILCNRAFDINNQHLSPEAMIEDAIQNDELNSFVLVVPTAKHVRRFQLKIINEYFDRKKKPTPKLNIFTLSELVKHCFFKYKSSSEYKIISDAYRLSLFEEAFENADIKFLLKLGTRVSPAILQRVAGIVSGLKEDGITVHKLKQDIAHAIEENDEKTDIKRLTDICSVYEQYQKLLAGKYLDEPELLNLTINEFIDPIAQQELFNNEKSDDLKGIEKLNNVFDDIKTIMIYGFSEFKYPETEFLSLFSKSNIPTAIHIEYSVKNGPLFGNLENSIISLSDRGFQLYSLSDSDTNESSPSFFLRKYLFRNDTKVCNDRLASSIKVIKAENRQDEVKSITKLVKYLLTSEKLHMSDICVCMRRPNLYSEMFRESFALSEMPVNISDRFSMANSSVVTSVFAILDIVSKDFLREDVHRAAESPYLSYKFENGKKEHVIDSKNLYNSALKMRVRGGFRRGGSKSWISIFEFGIKLKEKIIKNPGSSDPYAAGNLRNEIKQLRKALEDIKILKEMLPWENKEFLPDEFSNIIKTGIITQFNVRKNLSDKYHNTLEHQADKSDTQKIFVLDQIEKEARALSELINLIDEMTYILSDRYPGKKFKIEEYVKRFKTAVSGEKHQIREKQDYGVNITSVEQTRGIPYKASILCGALDGEFPITYRPESFLGKELPETEIRHIHAERIKFYQFLTNNPDALDSGENQIFITYPRMKDAEELVKSPFIDALYKISTIEKNNKVYDLTEIRKAIDSGSDDENLIQQYAEIPWCRAITDKEELTKHISDGTIGTDQLDSTDDLNLDYLKFVLDISNKSETTIDKTQLSEAVNDQIENFKTKIYSVSELESYAKCPYKYFLTRFLQLDDISEEDDMLSPMERGNVYHEILYKFFTTLQSKIKNTPNMIMPNNPDLPPIIPVILDPLKKDKYLKLLRDIAEEELNRIRFDHPFFEIEEDEMLGTESHKGLLEIWLNAELERVQKDEFQYLPALFEFGFGMSSKHSDKEEIPAIEIKPGLTLRGKIDRVEIFNDSGSIKLMIGDYKSSFSSLPGNSEILKGTAFQMPLYLKATQLILRDYYNIDVQANGGIYYPVRPKYEAKKDKTQFEKMLLITPDNPIFDNFKRSKTIVIKENDDLDINGILDLSTEAAMDIIDRLYSGDFPLEPADPRMCQYCSFNSTCRIRDRERIDVEEEEE
jgi:ATP-dependent helicase/nuclease subunit B